MFTVATTNLKEITTNTDIQNKTIAELTSKIVEQTKVHREELKQELENFKITIAQQKEIFETQLREQKAMFEEEIKAKNIEIAKIDEIKEDMKVLNKLPIAFSEYISQNATLVKNGTAKKVNKTLGVGMDNVQKTIQSTTNDKVGE